MDRYIVSMHKGDSKFIPLFLLWIDPPTNISPATLTSPKKDPLPVVGSMLSLSCYVPTVIQQMGTPCAPPIIVNVLVLVIDTYIGVKVPTVAFPR